jgi:uncharacterized protein with HEPN domain
MRRDLLFLTEMIDAAEQAIGLVEGRSVDQIEADRTVKDALMWNYTVLGEAAAKLSDELRGEHPEVPWRLAVALRNRIVHGYWSIDVDVVHTTSAAQLPGLVQQLRQILAAETDRS